MRGRVIIAAGKGHQIRGTVIVAAIQIGGDPSQLETAIKLSKSEKGNYYSSECQFTDLDYCVNISTLLQDYTTGNKTF